MDTILFYLSLPAIYKGAAKVAIKSLYESYKREKMKQLVKTKVAKDFLHGVDLDYIEGTIHKINFNNREKLIIDYILKGLSVKEMSIELNLSTSFISALKQDIYSKIYDYLQLKQ